jgi:hypothetical protein
MLGISFKEFIERGNGIGIDKVTIAYGNISYKVWNRITYQFETIQEESYEEALHILEQEPSSTCI